MSPPARSPSSRTRSRTASRSGWHCCTCSPAPPSDGSRPEPRLAGRSCPRPGGTGELVVVDGILETVTWLDRGEADGIEPTGVVVTPGFVDLHAHLREPGNE